MKPLVQISLDLTTIDEALQTAELAIRAGVDWLEAGTPLILAEGLHGVRSLRERFPDVPIVADLKTMDGGYLEAEMMAKAGATHVVVMAQAHEETIKCVVKAGNDYGIGVMGDNLGYHTMVDGAKRLQDLAVVTSCTILATTNDAALLLAVNGCRVHWMTCEPLSRQWMFPFRRSVGYRLSRRLHVLAIAHLWSF